MKDVTAKTIEVTNEDDRTFIVRVIAQGDGYGVDDYLTHEKSDVMVEFYDAEHKFDKSEVKDSSPMGQYVMVSRYYLSTISRDRTTGINLHGRHPEWNVSLENVQDVIKFAKQF